MELYIKYNIDQMCKVLLQQQLDKFEIDCKVTEPGYVKFRENIPMEKYNQLIDSLKEYGIEIVDNQKSILVQKIKNAIIEMLYADKGVQSLKISSYLSEKLNESYRTLSQVFSEVTFISIENFIILHKIERVKQLLMTESLSLTEISFMMNYSSVAYLSQQFKNITGVTPTTFQKIMRQKRIAENNI
ncbi:helix-turn-helix domain-containing protein [Flavobacterium rakeshii]|uniref:Helix-turn-helix domain-containing protein n=2 Tax=Flavobacterium TaxID=237 RepID=A0A6N8HH24_9FLAO|nr:AraC family transcriptional regulator [Flavobacterium rakeshii]MEE1899340.1 AraC family transcriptional regulator [Flavobacterium rakeshii]MUV05044.1 helix-turn-helix domain-containing protein [Flavobacterium rakeshii]